MLLNFIIQTGNEYNYKINVRVMLNGWGGVDRGGHVYIRVVHVPLLKSIV